MFARHPSAVEAVVEEVRPMLPTGAVLVNRPTVPVGTAQRTADLLDRPDIAPGRKARVA